MPTRLDNDFGFNYGEFDADIFNPNSVSPEYILRMFWIVLAITIAVLMICAAVYLIFMGLGLARIAKRKGVSNAWMGFFPILNLYLLGKVSHIPERRSRIEIPLIILSALSAVFMIGWLANILPMYEFILEVVMMKGRFSLVDYGPEIAGSYIAGILMGFICSGLFIATRILTFIAAHRVFKQFSPYSANVMTVFMVLGMAIHPFMLFAIRNNSLWPTGKPKAGDGVVGV